MRAQDKIFTGIFASVILAVMLLGVICLERLNDGRVKTVVTQIISAQTSNAGVK